MSAANQFDWVDFYKELANKLLEYKKNRMELVEMVPIIYEKTGLVLPRLESDQKLTDIDPFTFFGLFNKSISKNNREKIIKVVAELFSVDAPIPNSFDGIPLLNNMNAIFYLFKEERKENDMDNLWLLFESALDYDARPTLANRQKLSTYFDLIIQQKFNGISKITMGLFWIAPDSLLNLDKCNRQYIYESQKIPADVVETLPVIDGKIDSSTYFIIVEKLKSYLQSNRSNLKDFKDLSLAAWLYSNKPNPPKGVDVDDDVKTTRYWTYSPGEGAAVWDECYDNGIIAIGWEEIGDLSQYRSKSDMKEAMQEKIDRSRTFRNDAHATWQFANDMKPGDVVFAKKGKRLIIGRGVVESDYYFDQNRKMYNNVRKVKWTHKGLWKFPDALALKTLTDVTPYTDYVDRLESLFEDVVDKVVKNPTYDAANFLKEVYMNENDYETLTALLQTKKNVILQGAPGVGKTFAAKRLAYSIMGVKDVSRVMMVQFHQSYSYEDFIMGFRPSETGFELKNGAFYKFCKDAEIDSDNDYFFIIDEINRGNLSKIFGELFMLIEGDKRDQKIQLLYSDEKFSVPRNVYIIGMMNTADRSLAMLDYALRRRFAFFEMKPSFDSKGFKNYQNSLNSEKFNHLINCVKGLNEAIVADESLGEGFCIGHSYFCNLNEGSDQALSAIVEFELIPLLKEYWFDEPTKVRNWTDSLRNVIK